VTTQTAVEGKRIADERVAASGPPDRRPTLQKMPAQVGGLDATRVPETEWQPGGVTAQI
jgi:hypothetical protein